MATLAVLRFFTPPLRASALLLRSIQHISGRCASKTSKVASKATPSAKLPASTTTRKCAKTSSVNLTGSAAATPKVKRAAKAAEANEASQATKPAKSYSSMPKAAEEPVTTTPIVPQPFYGRYYSNPNVDPDWSEATRSGSWTSKRPTNAATSLAAKLLTRSSPWLQSPIARTSPFSYSQANNNAVVHQYFCRGLACKARSYTSSAYAVTPDPVPRINLGSVAMTAASASLGAGATLGAVQWMSFKPKRTVEQAIVEEPITQELQRLV